MILRRQTKQKASQASFNQHHVESFLSCLRRLRETDYMFPLDFFKIMRFSKECILFGPDWESLSAITRLTFIDDSDNCYGKFVNEYKEELKSMGVITEIKHGLNFVTTCLK